ncbi:unnamed protein product [Aspergillus niger]|uniref:Contig An03c0160, genomic contig n=1 Tax=Aspergillus niger (strain ATCC MYA-4892 / CBS 513.88 / FGSC A1513) TaxID=425011 RepID=A2QH27_ASPNC|nr:unnamed protein product [Aspergillus niger]
MEIVNYDRISHLERTTIPGDLYGTIL